MIATLEALAWGSLFLLLTIWVVYPLAVAALARLREYDASALPPESPLDDDVQASVSVIIATREPATAVTERVRDLVRTTFPADRLQIIIAHERGGRGIDLTDPEFQGFDILCVPADVGNDKPAALNAGVRAADGEILAFGDTYQRWDPETIACLAEPFDRPGIGGVTGNYHLAEGAGSLVARYWAFEKWLRSKEAAVHSSVGATGAVWAMRSALWKPLPAGLILDDVWSPMRIALEGHRVAVASGALARETRKPAPGREYSRKVRTLTGVFQLCAWMPDVLVPLRNPIWVQFLFHKLLRMLTPYCLIAPALWLLAIALLAIGPTLVFALAVTLAVAGLWIGVSGGSRTARLRRLIAEAVLLQLAVVVAGYNGVRRNWQVWD